MAQGPSGCIFGSVDHDRDLGVQSSKSELRLHISFAFTTVRRLLVFYTVLPSVKACLVGLVLSKYF